MHSKEDKKDDKLSSQKWTARGLEAPIVPYCRKQMNADTMWLPVVDQSTGIIQLEQRVVMFGGLGRDYESAKNKRWLGDLWMLHITNVGFKWSLISDVEAAAGFAENDLLPGGRWKFGMSSFNDSRALLIYGGDDENSGSVNFLGDLWSFEPESANSERTPWVQRVYGGSGPGERRGIAADVTRNGTLVVQGGKSVLDTSKQLCDCSTFMLNLSPKNTSPIAWLSGSPLPAECRWGHTLTSLGWNHVALFGGRTLIDKAYVYFNDLWVYDVDKQSWLEIVPGGELDDDDGLPKIPAPRDHHTAVYVEELDALYIFGGRQMDDKEEPPLNDLWSFSFKSKAWKEHRSAGHGALPLPRFAHAMSIWRGGAGDGRPQLVVIGGESFVPKKPSSKKMTGQLMNDVWMYDTAGNQWKAVAYSDCSAGATGLLAASSITMPFLAGSAGLLLVVGFIGLLVARSVQAWKKPAYEAIS